MTIEELLEKSYWLIDILEEGERNPDPAKIARTMRSETVWLRRPRKASMSGKARNHERIHGKGSGPEE